MNILVSNLSQTPIYEQIKSQIKQAVMNSQLHSGDQLPSIRVLAKELMVGVITVKRAYDDLCNEKILVSLAGRGVFVADTDKNQLMSIQLEELSEKLSAIKHFCDVSNISKDQLLNEITKIWGHINE